MNLPTADIKMAASQRRASSHRPFRFISDRQQVHTRLITHNISQYSVFFYHSLFRIDVNSMVLLLHFRNRKWPMAKDDFIMFAVIEANEYATTTVRVLNTQSPDVLS